MCFRSSTSGRASYRNRRPGREIERRVQKLEMIKLNNGLIFRQTKRDVGASVAGGLASEELSPPR